MQETEHQLAVEQAIGLMKNHLHEDLSLEEIAESVYFSPYYFNRLFRQHIGVPPGEFFTALRINTAKRLLLTTSLRITDICYEVGYTSIGSFTTRFTQSVGLSPRALRLCWQRMEPREKSEVPEVERQHQLSGRSIINGTYQQLACLTGRISTTQTFQGHIYIGLFPKPIPQGRPIACTKLAAPGMFHIVSRTTIPDGQYYLLSAAFPQDVAFQTLLLPDASILVSIAGPVCVSRGRVREPVSLALRPWQWSDPPLIVAAPFL